MIHTYIFGASSIDFFLDINAYIFSFTNQQSCQGMVYKLDKNFCKLIVSPDETWVSKLQIS